MDRAWQQNMPAPVYETVANYTYDWESWLGPDGRPRWINPAVKRMTGYAVTECMAMADYPLPLVHPDDRATMQANLASAASGGSGNDVAFRICHRDGRVLWGAISWQSLYDETGRALGFRTSVRDITQRKEAEAEQARARSAAEEANRSKSRFLAAASHDLRQPIQAASLFVAALRQRTEAPELLALVDQVGQCLSATQALLDQLLDMSRLDAQLLKVEPREMALGDLFERLEMEFAELARERRLRFRVAATSHFLHADPLLLYRILQNLVGNALRYTGEGGVLLGARRCGNAVRVSVYDSGVGIAADKLDIVFQEFQQLDNPARDRTRGLGLGLAIVKRLAALMEFPIGVQSIPGRGSCFWVEVPMIEASAGSAMPVLPEPRVPRGRRLCGRTIAILEDEPNLLAGMREYLSGEGAVVIGAADRDTLLSELREANEAPAILIVDYRLGDLTGVEAARTVEDALGRALPTLVITGDTEPARLSEARASGHRLLHKPVEPAVLVDCLREILEEQGTRHGSRRDAISV